jgi:uncharacterized membrane protein
MVVNVFDAVLVVAMVTGGLIAGVFFVFTCAITPALRRVDDETYVTTFRAINTAIVNGAFLAVFSAAPLSALATAVLGVWLQRSSPSWWLWAGATCSVLTLVITTAANVPLNRGLDQAPVATGTQRRAARRRFETRWNRWNLARTVTSTAALACLAVAAVPG